MGEQLAMVIYGGTAGNGDIWGTAGNGDIWGTAGNGDIWGNSWQW